MTLEKLKENASWGPLVLRFVAGAIFLVAGIGKLGGIAGFAGGLANAGFPAATFFAWLVALIEVIGGVLLILGVLTQSAAIPLGIIMVVSTIVKLMGNFGGPAFNALRVDLLLLAALIVILFQGAGKWALYDKC